MLGKTTILEGRIRAQKYADSLGKGLKRQDEI